MSPIPSPLCSTTRAAAIPCAFSSLWTRAGLPALCGVLALMLGGAWPSVHAQTAHFVRAESVLANPANHPASSQAVAADGQVLEVASSNGNFGTVNVGSASPTPVSMVFTFDTPGTLESITVATQGATDLDFVNAGTGTCKAGVSYAAGGTCTVNVSFTPRFAGTRYGAAKLLDGSGKVLAVGFVQGTGVGPQVSFLPGTQSVIANSTTNGLSEPEGVAVDGSGNVYISDYENMRVLKETLSADGYIQSVVADNANNGLGSPVGLAVDGGGDLYIADPDNNRVLKETLVAGVYTQSVVANYANSGLVTPEAVAVDGSGNVYIADIAYDDGKVWKETLSAGVYTPSVVASIAINGLSFPYGVAVDGSGNVYIVDYGSTRVLKETPSKGGYTQSVVANAAANGLISPITVAVDGSGNVFIADLSSNQVLKETPSAGSYIQTIVANAPTNGLYRPFGVAVDGSGNLYIADQGNSRVLKEDLPDPPSLTFASTAVGKTSTDSPKTVTVSNDGNAALTFPLPAVGGNPSVPANFDWDPSSTCVQTTTSSSEAFQLAGGASCTMAFDFKPTMTGNISGIAEVTDNNLNAAAPGYAIQSIALNVNEAGELILTASPASLDVVRGSSSTSTLNLNGFTGAVTFAVQGLPANVTASFAPNPATGSSVLTFTAGSTAAAGTYNLTITGSSGAQQAATSLDLTVNASPSFALSASPSSLVVFEDASVTSTVMVLPIQPFAGDVNLTAFGVPSGITASFGTNPTTGSSILTLTASSTAPTGTYNLTITGTSATGTQTAPASLALQVRAQNFTPPSRNFGAVNLGTTSPAQVLTYTFVAAETLGSTAVLTQGGTGLDFADAGTGTCKAGVSYAAGKTCTVDVKFTPKFAGSRNGAVELLDGSGNVLATGYLQGTGVGPQVNFAPGGLSLVADVANVIMDDTDAMAVAVDGSGNVYFCDQWNFEVLKETLTSGGYVETVIASYETDGVRVPSGVAVDGSGNVYIADYGSGRVLKETPSASGYAGSVVANSANNGLGSPWAVAVDSSGNVYIADVHYDITTGYSSRLLKETLSPSGYTQSVITSNANSSQFYLVAVDGSGNIYIADTNNNESRVLKETPSAGGYTQSVITDQAHAVIGAPSGLAVDGSGNLYFTVGYSNYYISFDNSQVLKVTPSAGGYIESVLLDTGRSPVDPYGIAVDGGGNLYVSSLYGQVGKVDLVDPPSLTFLPTALGSTSFDSPQTVTVSNNGNAPLIFPSSGSGGNPSVPANFALDSTSTCKQTTPGSSAPVQLAAWTSCTLALDFKPTSAAPVSGLVELTDNNQNVTGSVQAIHVAGSISQMIDFPQPASPMYLGAAPITLNATGGASGNPVTFSINSGYGILSGPNNSVLTVTGTGTLVVAAHQAGNAGYAPAPEVTRSITVLLSATLTSPTPGSTLTGSNVTFTWEAGTGVTECYLLLGSNGVGSSNLYNSGYTMHRSVKVTGLPTNGATIYARLYSLMNGVWHHLDYTYTAASLAAITSPPPGSTLAGSNVTFTWSGGAGISKYYLVLGSTGVGSENLYNSGYTTHTSVNVTGLPTNGETIYARLYWQVDGDWRHLDTTYTAE